MGSFWLSRETVSWTDDPSPPLRSARTFSLPSASTSLPFTVAATDRYIMEEAKQQG